MPSPLSASGSFSLTSSWTSTIEACLPAGLTVSFTVRSPPLPVSWTARTRRLSAVLRSAWKAPLRWRWSSSAKGRISSSTASSAPVSSFTVISAIPSRLSPDVHLETGVRHQHVDRAGPAGVMQGEQAADQPQPPGSVVHPRHLRRQLEEPLLDGDQGLTVTLPDGLLTALAADADALRQRHRRLAVVGHPRDQPGQLGAQLLPGLRGDRQGRRRLHRRGRLALRGGPALGGPTLGRGHSAVSTTISHRGVSAYRLWTSRSTIRLSSA